MQVVFHSPAPEAKATAKIVKKHLGKALASTIIVSRLSDSIYLILKDVT